METKDTTKLSTDELLDYVETLNQETIKIEAEIKKLKASAKLDRLKTIEIKKQIAEVTADNERIKRLKGWEDITDDEMLWLMDGNYEKMNKYFEPGVETIKLKYAEAMGKKVVKSTRFDKHPEFAIPNAWINRAGKYFPVHGFAQHDQWAREYLESINKPTEERGKHSFEILESYGWVRIMKWEGLEAKFILPKKLTHAQKKTIDIYCTLYKWPLPFNDELFN